MLYLLRLYLIVFYRSLSLKTKDCSPIVRKKHQKTTVRFHCAYLLPSLPAFLRRSIRLIHLCMFPDSDLSSPRFPSQTLRFSGFMSKAPSIQWRDRAGFAPASILAFYPAARKTPAVKPVGFPLQSAEKKEHKSSSVFSFSKKYFTIKPHCSQAPRLYFSTFMPSPVPCAASVKSAAGAG